MSLKKILAAPAFVFLCVCGGMAVSTASGVSAQVIDESQVDSQLAALRSISETAHDENRRFRPPGKNRIRYAPAEARARTMAQLENLALGGHRELILPAARYFRQYADFLRDKKTDWRAFFPIENATRGRSWMFRNWHAATAFIPSSAPARTTPSEIARTSTAGHGRILTLSTINLWPEAKRNSV